MHKVTSMEAHRVLAVLDDALERLACVGRLPLDAGQGAALGLVEQLMQEDARDTGETLRQLALVEAAMPATQALGPETDETAAAAVRDFCRAVRSDARAAEILKGSRVRNPRTDDFVNQLSQLKSVSFRHMSTTIEEETTNRELLHDLDEKVQRAERQQERLQQALDQLCTERDKEFDGFDQTLNKLSAEKRDLSRANRSELSGIEQDMSDQIEKNTLDHTAGRKRLEEEAKKLRIRLAEASDEHRELENTQRRLMARKEKELSDVIEAYDTTMSAKLAEMEDVQERMAEEKKEFLQLEEHFDRVDANMAKKAEEEKVIRDLMEREAMARAILADNAAVIQTLVRVRHTRAEFLRAMAKRNKKKGKGKGGKKKKKA